MSKNLTANQHEPTRIKTRVRTVGLCTSWLNFFCIFFISANLFAQPDFRAGGRDDSEAALQYVIWIEKAIEEGKKREALAALNRASDFSNVSSDIPYLTAVMRKFFLNEGETRLTVLEALETAIETNRWTRYNENQALLLKTEMLIAVREYTDALVCIEKLEERINAGRPPLRENDRADTAMMRLLVFRAMAANGNIQALARFRSLVVAVMDRFPRDPRPLGFFFEYARNRMPLTQSDLDLMELVLRRLPFLLETDPELAWKAAPFIRNNDEARRLIASYRSGGIPHIQNRDFKPHPASIAAALNLGLIDDTPAADELFSGSRGFNYPHPPEISPDGNPFLDIEIINDVYNLLRSEEGRVYFTGKLLNFTGTIFSDDDRDGYIDTCVQYNSGIITAFTLDANQDASGDWRIVFAPNSVPASAEGAVMGQSSKARIQWERYPFVQNVKLNDEEFLFRPADFQFAPLEFTELGGSRNMSGLLYPVHVPGNLDLTRRALVLHCSVLSCPGAEFENSRETFFMRQGIPLRAEERILSGVLNGETASVTEFDRGYPVIQYIDLDLDGRKETIRRFRRPNPSDEWDFRDYRGLIASSESDWQGDGRHITREVYLPDGSVVYYFDMDGSGEFNYTENRR